MPYSPKTWNLSDPITPTDLNRIETGIDNVTATVEDDTGWLTSGIVAASGWAIDAQTYRRVGSVVSLYLQIHRTGATISVGATGNITNVVVATLPSGFVSPVNYQVFSSGDTGPLCTFSTNTDGSITLCATAPSVDITTNTILTAGGTYLV